MKYWFNRTPAFLEGFLLGCLLIALAGCTSGTIPADQSTRTASHRTLFFASTPAEILWNTFPMDYNALEKVMHEGGQKAEASRLWQGLPLPDKTKETFAGYCGSYSYCTPLNFVDEKGAAVTGSAMVIAYGIMTTITPSDLPYFSGMRVYYWEFGSNSSPQDEQANLNVFSNDHYYIFCLDKTFTPHSVDNPLHNIPALAPHLSGIIEIEPTFIAGQANPVIDVTPETLVEYTTYRQETPEFRFIAKDNVFAWSFEGKSGAVDPSSVPVTKLVYALRTIKWKALPKDDNVEKNPSPVDTIIRIRSGGSTQQLKLKYHNGLWYFRSADNVLWGAPFPQLLYKVQGEFRDTLGKAGSK